MITLHIGLPKTASTLIQSVLSASADKLSEAGVDYLDILRDGEGLGHHTLPKQLLAANSLDTPAFKALCERVSADRTRHVVVSSEAFTNLIVARNRVTFLAMTEALSTYGAVRIVIALRRVDDFFSSMYLHSIKTGEVHDQLSCYVEKRRQWSMSLFNGLRLLRQQGLVDELLVIKYASKQAFSRCMLAAILSDTELVDDLATMQSRNVAVTHKAHVALANLDAVNARIGYNLRRFPLIRAFEMGRFAFPTDQRSFRVIEPHLAKVVHSEALAAAEHCGERDYCVFFEGDSVPELAPVSLDISHLEDADFAALGDYAQRARERGDKAAFVNA
ncbi:MAG: hypothetical protein AAGF45_01785 [Pseudomonadota bacterium]